MALRAVQQVMVQHMALGHVDNTWLVKRLSGRAGERLQQTALYYLEQLSKVSMTRMQRRALEAKAIALDGLVPATLALSAADTERLVRADLFLAVLDAKLTQPLSMAVLVFDGAAILGLLAVTTPLWPRVLAYDGALLPLDAALVTAVYALAGVLLLRELLQAYSMHTLGVRTAHIQGSVTYVDPLDAPQLDNSLSALGWLSDSQNVLDLLLVGMLALTAHQATQPARIEHTFLAPMAAATQGLLYLELLSYVKVINQKFATYVLCLVQIAADVRSFLVIMLLVMLAFANMFYIIAYRGRLGLPQESGRAAWPGAWAGAEWPGTSRLLHATSGDPPGAQDGAAPLGEDIDPSADVDLEGFEAFATVAETLISVYRLMIGDFEREWFQTPFLVALFLAYTFIVMILLLNILIAVVSDSYDFAIVRSNVLFRRARLDLAAELEALSGLLRSHSQDGAHNGAHNGGATYRRLNDEEAPPGTTPPSEAAAADGTLWGRLQAAIRMRGHDDEAEGAPADEGDEGGEGWLGRALDTERRVKRLLQDSRVATDASQRAMEERLMAHMDGLLQRHPRT